MYFKIYNDKLWTNKDDIQFVRQ